MQQLRQMNAKLMWRAPKLTKLISPDLMVDNFIIKRFVWSIYYLLLLSKSCYTDLIMVQNEVKLIVFIGNLEHFLWIWSTCTKVTELKTL